MRFGGDNVVRAQLKYLLVLSEQPNITVAVIPFGAGTFPGSGQTVNYFEGPVRQLDTVEIDSTHGPEFLYGEAQLDKYRAYLDWMENMALSPDGSRDFIHSVASNL